MRLRLRLLNSLGKMVTCKSWPIVHLGQATILVKVDVHNYKSHHCFSFTLSFKTRCTSKTYPTITKFKLALRWDRMVFISSPFLVIPFFQWQCKRRKKFLILWVCTEAQAEMTVCKIQTTQVVSRLFNYVSQDRVSKL